MEAVSWYGYTPTSWIAISFAVSCLLAVITLIPTLFFKYRNLTLGCLITVGFLLQLSGHACMAISSYYPDNLAAYATQRWTFQFGKIAARYAALYVYYTCFSRITYKIPNFRNVPEGYLGISVLPWGLRVVLLAFETACECGHTNVCVRPALYPIWVIVFSISMLFTICFIVFLLYVIIKTRHEVAWHKLSWVMGYYITLQVVPFFILTQDIYDLIKTIAPFRVEMLDLIFDMGMTKSMLMALSAQTYEMACAWATKRPKYIEMLELWIREYLELPSPSSIPV